MMSAQPLKCGAAVRGTQSHYCGKGIHLSGYEVLRLRGGPGCPITLLLLGAFAEDKYRANPRKPCKGRTGNSLLTGLRCLLV